MKSQRRRTPMKQITRLAKVAFLLLALALPALAAKPIIVENPVTPFVIPAAGGCGTFDVSGAQEVGKPSGQAILFANSAILAGPAFVTLTNLSTGKSINLNLSGADKIVYTNNGITVVDQGLTLAFGLPANAPPDLQGVVVANGRIVSQLDNSGNLISVTFTGTTQNVCQLLQ